MGLSEKQQRFVTEYLVDFNATQAAIRAGYSDKTAMQQGSRLLSHVEVQAAVAVGARAQRQALQDRADLTRERLLEEYRRICYIDLADCFDDEGKLRPLRSLPKEVRAAIASVKVTKKNLAVGDGVMDDVVEVKLWDKLKAMQDMAKHLKLLDDAVNIHVGDDVVDAILQKARQRAAKHGGRSR